MTSRGMSGAWLEARALLWRQRRALGVGLGLVVVNRLAALAVPTASKFVIDDVIGRQRADLLGPIVLLTGGAIALEVLTAFGVSQVSGITAQRAVTTLRRELQVRVVGLPVGAFDTTQTGTLVSRIMTDPDQVHHVVGTGMVQLLSSLLTAGLAFGILFYLNPALTVVLVAILVLSGLGLTRAFGWLFPVFHGVSARTAKVTGWHAEALGGIRVVKTYVAERREALRFTREWHRLLRQAIRALTGVSTFTASSTLATGTVGILLRDVERARQGAGRLALVRRALDRRGQGDGKRCGGRPTARFARERGEDSGLRGHQLRLRTGRFVLREVGLHAHLGSTTALVAAKGRL